MDRGLYSAVLRVPFDMSPVNLLAIIIFIMQKLKDML